MYFFKCELKLRYASERFTLFSRSIMLDLFRRDEKTGEWFSRSPLYDCLTVALQVQFVTDRQFHERSRARISGDVTTNVMEMRDASSRIVGALMT